jgi:uncharacterized protein YodC (DUF2158 family)
MFNEGDTVQLKSGGPAMTIDKMNKENEYVSCKWFDGSELQQASFKQTSLIKIN